MVRNQCFTIPNNFFFTYIYLQSIYLSVLGLGLQDIDVVFKCMVPSERDNLHIHF